MGARDKKINDALRIFREPAEQPEQEAELPQVRAARERNRLARARVAAGEDYKPSEAELVEARAWGRRGRR
jgi:hypothetical protein